MKKRIDTSGDVHTYAELTPLKTSSHHGWWRLKISTVYDTARNPDEEQVQLDMCMDEYTLECMKDLFNGKGYSL